MTLSGKVQHELACASCGAPLHELKKLPVSGKVKKSKAEKSLKRVGKPAKTQKPRKPKKRKRLMSRFLEEAFDVIEDILD